MLLLEGKSTSQIAKILLLKISTIGSVKARIFKKMNADNIVELIKKSSTPEHAKALKS